MKINIKATNLYLTPSLKTYIDNKFATLSKIISKFESQGEILIHFEVARTTRHHHKGEVFMTEANLALPGKTLRAAEGGSDVRRALDVMLHKLKLEIEKYKNKKRRIH